MYLLEGNLEQGVFVIKVLFVCTGNICRSPTAEGVFRHLVAEQGLDNRFCVDSAGIDSYHEGEKPDARAIRTAKKRGVEIGSQRARRLSEQDYFEFDYILAMDGGHYYEIQVRAPERRKARIEMFLRSASEVKDTEVPDPWYGNEKDFEDVYALIEKGARALLERLREENKF